MEEPLETWRKLRHVHLRD